jgi:hypothetical protein
MVSMPIQGSDVLSDQLPLNVVYNLGARGVENFALSLGGAIVAKDLYEFESHSRIKVWFPNSLKNYCFLITEDGAQANIIGDPLIGAPLSYKVVDLSNNIFHLRHPKSHNYLTLERNEGVVVSHTPNADPIRFCRCREGSMTDTELEQLSFYQTGDVDIAAFTSEEAARQLALRFSDRTAALVASQLRLFTDSAASVFYQTLEASNQLQTKTACDLLAALC